MGKVKRKAKLEDLFMKEPVFFGEADHHYGRTTYLRVWDYKVDFRQIQPNHTTSDYIEITRWYGIPAKKDLWVKIVKHRAEIILSLKEIEGIYKKLKQLKRLPEKTWDREEENDK